MKKSAFCWSRFDSAVLICTLLLYGAALRYLQPIILPSTFIAQDMEEPIAIQHAPFPTVYKNTIDLDLRVWMRQIRPSALRIEVYDCIRSLSINGKKITDKGLMKCHRTAEGFVLKDTTMLRRGVNIMQITALSWRKNGIRITVPHTDPLKFVLHFALLCIIGFYGWKGIRKTFLWQKHRDLMGIFLIGALLRSIYMLSTRIWERSYDWQGHWDYILYVLQHWNIPLTSQGWQYYQPPLFYFMNAVALFPATLLTGNEYPLMRLAQAFSLGISIAALGAGIWIGTLLFPEKENQKRLLFAAGLAFFPGLVFHASRVSNDTLLLLISFLFFGFLYRWWIRGSERDLLIASVCVACGLLTKSSALPLAALLFLCILIHQPRHWRTSLRNVLLCFAILFALTGWHYTLRFMVEGNQHIVGNIDRNGPTLYIDTIEKKNFYTFRPIAVLQQPFNNPLNDRRGRRFFWEHLTKSSLAGEWELGDELYTTMQFLLMLIMLFAVLGTVGLIRTIRHQLHASLPILATGVVLTGSMMVLVMQKPVGGFQDFRYIPLLAVPVLYCILQGTDVLPIRIRNIPVLLLLLFYTFCVAFFMILLAH